MLYINYIKLFYSVVDIKFLGVRVKNIKNIDILN